MLDCLLNTKFIKWQKKTNQPTKTPDSRLVIHIISQAFITSDNARENMNKQNSNLGK